MGEWREEWGVQEEELRDAVKRMRTKNKSPGPSGVPGRVWAASVAVIAGHHGQLFNDYLRGGVFPQPWRMAKLVLLRKEGKPADTHSGYRPICLLDEEAKLIERIIAGRLVRHLEERSPDLHSHQFGFRRNRCITDAILRVRASVEAAVGEVVICISLDISNAFNTLPWDRIEELYRNPPILEEGPTGLLLGSEPGVSRRGWCPDREGGVSRRTLGVSPRTSSLKLGVRRGTDAGCPSLWL